MLSKCYLAAVGEEGDGNTRPACRRACPSAPTRGRMRTVLAVRPCAEPRGAASSKPSAAMRSAISTYGHVFGHGGVASCVGRSGGTVRRRATPPSLDAARGCVRAPPGGRTAVVQDQINGLAHGLDLKRRGTSEEGPAMLAGQVGCWTPSGRRLFFSCSVWSYGRQQQENNCMSDTAAGCCTAWRACNVAARDRK